MLNSQALDAGRWRRIADCFAEAVERDEAERVAFVSERLIGDDGAVQEVLAMLGTLGNAHALSVEPRLLTSEDEAPLTGQQLGTYTVRELVGRGGMGEVYRGERHDGTFEQTVAIKVLRHGVYARELVQRFEVERRILARLAHPGIVTILDGGTVADRRPYLVMRFVDGKPITAWANEHQLGLEDRLRLFVSVADVVQYAHGQLVVHRDIKPSNILVSDDGKISLLDFGIARLLDPTTGETGEHTWTSPLRLLTPEHAAPEQVRGERAGVAADVYSLGVLLYELVSGVRPHVRGERSLAEFERELLEFAPLAPSAAGWSMSWKRRLRGDIDRIVLMAMRKAPERRYASAAQLAADVERFLDGLPVRATADSVMYRAGRFLRRHRLGATLGAAAAAILLALTAQAVSQTRRATRERDAARRAETSLSNVMGMLTSLFEKANPGLTPGGDTIRVSELLTLAQAKVDSLADDPLTQAQLQSVLGEMHYARGRADLAAGYFRRALATLKPRSDANPLLVARTALNLARATTEYEGPRTAYAIFEDATRRFEALFGDTAAETVIARRELLAADTSTESRTAYLEGIVADSALAAIADTIERAGRIHALGVNRYRAGDIIAAAPLFEEALRLLDLKLPRDHPTRWVVFSTVAAAHNKSGRFAQAEAMARALLESQTTRVPVNRIGLAHAHEFLAVVLSNRGFLDEAEARQRAAVQLWSASLAPSHPSRWNGLCVLATILSARGRYQEALLMLDSAQTLGRAGTAVDRMYISEQRVDVLLRSGRFVEAMALLEQTALVARTFAERHLHRWSHEWRESVALGGLNRYSEALQRLTEADSGLRSTVPRQHPVHDGVTCLRGVLRARAQTAAATDRGPHTACAQYAKWGLALPALARWNAEMTNP
jgi:serine/threonine-protein kinase